MIAEVCKCGELAHLDSYTRKIERCSRCEAAICTDCAWCGEGVHEECSADEEDRKHFSENRKLRAFYEAEEVARKERVRVRWNAEHASLLAAITAEIGGRASDWREDRERQLKIQARLQAEEGRIEQEELHADIRARRVAEGGAS